MEDCQRQKLLYLQPKQTLMSDNTAVEEVSNDAFTVCWLLNLQRYQRRLRLITETNTVRPILFVLGV